MFYCTHGGCLFFSTVSTIYTAFNCDHGDYLLISTVSTSYMVCLTAVSETSTYFKVAYYLHGLVLLYSRKRSTYFNGVCYLKGVFYCNNGDCLLV